MIRAGRVELLSPPRIRLVETVLPELSPAHRAAVDRRWEEAVRANPALFDGPVAALTGLERDGRDALVLSWARATYRHRALRELPDAPVCSSLFVSVAQPSEDGRLLVGRMAASTAAPGRWQLPGGSVEPPDEGVELDVDGLRRHAARELAEETGSATPAGALRLWLTTRGAGGGVGVVFLAPPSSGRELRERYARLVSTETGEGREPEFDQIELVRPQAGAAGLEGPCVDHLEPVLGRYANASA
ncbi:NUDIX domain-containing protein [Streptomyces cellostaticus]|uniref:NUDIX domain-containing protein n=1 Tax=Streptomyces cellostaticus TaxID=67285 RepID=UPI00202707F4|nr:NUDIX domain-containing protein [Streptomyces cellostaticus]